MPNKKILICGDSFSANWYVKTKKYGWPNFLSDMYTVTNISQAGCSQYKIYLQVSNSQLSNFDKIIISHTSPYRIYVKKHPIHNHDILHGSCDLIYEDLVDNMDKNIKVKSIVDFFENFYDLEYAKYIHRLICNDIEELIKPFSKKIIHVVNISYDDLYKFKDVVDNYEVFKSSRGDINHFNEQGNQIVFQRILDRIDK